MIIEWRRRPPGPGLAYEERLGEALALIESSAALEHSSTTLWDHLIGTFRILEAWGAPPDVCLAGLLHSVYSTQYFTPAVVPVVRRREVAKCVGEDAEQLAHWFCVLDRESIRRAEHGGPKSDGLSVVRAHAHGRGVRVPHPGLRRLRLIDIANEVEQQQRLGRPASTWLGQACATFRRTGFRPSHLSGAAAVSVGEESEGELRRTYESAVAAAGEESRRLLRRCVELYSHCAEARILLAASELEGGRRASAYLHARAGLRDLRGWGAAWDTRVPWRAWELLGQELIEHARAVAEDIPDLARQVLARLSVAVDGRARR